MDKVREKEISILLLELGFQPHLAGYKYMRSAIEMVILKPSLLQGKITKEIYPGVAAIHQTTASRVERAMRHSIDQAHGLKTHKWSRLIGHYHHSPEPPCNGFFLAQCAEVLRLELAS